MPDCPNGEIRDLLPDLVHDRLDAESRAQLHAHVADCGDCTAEIALLRRIRASAEAQRLPVVDVGRVVEALPAAGRRKSHWSRNTGLRIAAGLALLIAGASWMQKTRDVDDQPTVPAVVATVPTVSGGEGAVVVATTPRTPPRATTTPARVSLDNGLGDLSDGELQSLLAALDSFDAVTAVEPSVVEPILESERLR